MEPNLESVNVDELGKCADGIVRKFNPNHGPDGRFSSGGSRMSADRGGGGGGGGGGGKLNITKMAQKLSAPQKKMLLRLTDTWRDVHRMGRGFTFATARSLEKSGMAEVKPMKSSNGMGAWWGVRATKVGRAVQKRIEEIDWNESQKNASDVARKFNPNHGPDGRFSSGPGGRGHLSADKDRGGGGSGSSESKKVDYPTDTMAGPKVTEKSIESALKSNGIVTLQQSLGKDSYRCVIGKSKKSGDWVSDHQVKYEGESWYSKIEGNHIGSSKMKIRDVVHAALKIFGRVDKIVDKKTLERERQEIDKIANSSNS